MANARLFYDFPNKHWFMFWKFPKHYINFSLSLVFAGAPCQSLISFSYPHHIFLVFWELILGYVFLLDWYLHFLMVKFCPKHLLVLTPHSSNRDLNLKILKGKSIKKWDIIPKKHANWNLPKHGYQKLLDFCLGLPTMKVETWSCPWTKDEISLNVFWNMVVVEEFFNLPLK